MDLRGRELNHFKVAFFNMIGNAQHLTRSGAPSQGHSGLQSIPVFLGIGAPTIRVHVGWWLETRGWLDAHDVVRQRHLVVILKILVPLKAISRWPFNTLSMRWPDLEVFRSMACMFSPIVFNVSTITSIPTISIFSTMATTPMMSGFIIVRTPPMSTMRLATSPFIQISHALYVSFQLLDTGSLFLHQRYHLSERVGIPLWAEFHPGW